MDLEDEKVAAISSVDDEFEEEEEVEEEVDQEAREEVTVHRGEDASKGEEEVTQVVNGGSSSMNDSGKIFVGGVAWETTDETFAKHFEKYGEITDSVIMKDKQTQNPRGFGFVTFADPSVIDKVLEDEHLIDGRAVDVKRTVPREDKSSSKAGLRTKKIFVGGIPPSVAEDELKEQFSSYGKVAEHQIMVDHSTGRSRGFGFVTFESEDTVEKIISQGNMHDLWGKQVEIKKAEPKKAGRDAAYNGSSSVYAPSGGNMYRGGASGYGGDFQFDNSFFYGGRGGGYGQGYGYGGYPGFVPGFAGLMYGAGMYGAGYGYGGGAGGFGGGYGGGGGGGGGGGRGYGSRYHPYGR